MMLLSSPSGALLWRMWSCTASAFVKTIGSGGSSPPPIGTPGYSLSRTSLTLPAIRTPMWPSGRASITAWAPTLARLEGQEAFKALAQRFNELSLETEHLEYHPGNTFRSLVSLPVSWHSRSNWRQ
jgi:hypothetical protein